MKFQSFTIVYFIGTKFASNGSSYLADCSSLYSKWWGFFFLLVLISCLYHCRYFEVGVDTPPQHTHDTHSYLTRREGKESENNKPCLGSFSSDACCALGILHSLSLHPNINERSVMHEKKNSSVIDFLQLKLSALNFTKFRTRAHIYPRVFWWGCEL